MKFLGTGADASANAIPQSPPKCLRRNNAVMDNVAPVTAIGAAVNASVGIVLHLRAYSAGCVQDVSDPHLCFGSDAGPCFH